MSVFQDRFEGVWSPLYVKKLAFQIAMAFVIFAAISAFMFAFLDTNLIDMIFGKNKIIYGIIGISAIGIMFYRDTYLPFLGPMVAPCSVLENKEPPGATKEVKVVIEPNSKVMYWAAEPANEKLGKLNSWKEAYGKYENAGVTTSNAGGVATFKIRDPQTYKVPFMGKLDSHVHYRVCGDNGFIGTVRTAYINELGPEGFETLSMHKYKVTQLADSSASIY